MARQEIEIDEALGAVEDALGCLDAAARDLKSAGNWGWFDIFGGGFLTSMLKHGKMETAQRHLSAAQAALGRLADELNDVEGFAGLGPDVGDFLLTADWLFDNAFMDAMVQQRIIESQTAWRRQSPSASRCATSSSLSSAPTAVRTTAYRVRSRGVVPRMVFRLISRRITCNAHRDSTIGAC